MKLTASRVIGIIVLLITLIFGAYVIFVKDVPGTLVIPSEFRWLAGIVLIFTGIYIIYVIWPDKYDEYEEF